MSDGRCPVCDTAWTETKSVMTNETWYDCSKCKKTREQIEKELKNKAPEKTKQSSYSGFDSDSSDVPDWGDYDWNNLLGGLTFVDYNDNKKEGSLSVDPISGKIYVREDGKLVELNITVELNNIPKDLLTNKSEHLHDLTKKEIETLYIEARDNLYMYDGS